MMKLATVVLLLGGLALPLAAAGPDDARWQAHTERGEYAFAVGNMAVAEQELRAALEIAKRFPEGDRRLETSLANLGRLLEHRGRLDDAQPLYQLELAAREARLGPAHSALLEPLAAVARVALASGDAPTAEASLERYLEIAEATGEADPRQHRLVLDLLARQRTILGRPEEALPLKRRSVVLLDADPSLTDEERAEAMEQLARLEIAHGDAAAAEAAVTAAAAVRAKAGAPTAGLLAGAAREALAAGRAELAGDLAARALSADPDAGAELEARTVLAEAAWSAMPRGELRPSDLLGAGEDSPALAAAAEALAALLPLEEARYGPGSAEVVATLGRSALVAARRGRAAESVAAWRRVAAATPERSAEGREARAELVALLAASGDRAGAAEVNAALIAELEAAWGSEDPRLLEPLRRQQELLAELGQRREAKAVKKRIRQLERAAGR